MHPLNAIAFVAERKIEEAAAEGQFDNLPGMGKPLQLEDLSHLPAGMRMAYTILKNSGFLEKETLPGKTPSMQDLLASAREEKATYGKMQRLNVAMRKVRRAKEELGLAAQASEAPDSGFEDSPYYERLVSKARR